MNIANKLTLLRIALIPVFIVMFYIDTGCWNYYIAALVFIAAAITDLFDGALARKRNIVTNFGKLMDPIADKLLVSSALVLLASIGRIHPVFVIVLVGREFVISGFRLLAAAEGKVLAASGLAKAKTVTQIVMVVVLLLWNGWFGEWFAILGTALIWLGNALILVSVALSVISCADYFLKNRDIVKEMF